jgi:hypothetical protein
VNARSSAPAGNGGKSNSSNSGSHTSPARNDLRGHGYNPWTKSAMGSASTNAHPGGGSPQIDRGTGSQKNRVDTCINHCVGRHQLFRYRIVPAGSKSLLAVARWPKVIRWFLLLPSVRARIVSIAFGGAVAVVIALEWNPPTAAYADPDPIGPVVTYQMRIMPILRD